jgi:hypothetical protein
MTIKKSKKLTNVIKALWIHRIQKNIGSYGLKGPCKYWPQRRIYSGKSWESRPLKRMQPGDYIIWYAGEENISSDAKCQKFKGV